MRKPKIAARNWNASNVSSRHEKSPLRPCRSPRPHAVAISCCESKDLAKSFDKPLFENLTFDMLRGEKWAVMGPNGSGKTTLLRCLLEQLPPDAGRVIQGAGVKVGYFDQLLQCMDSDAEVVEAIRPGHKEFVESQRRDLLARYGITGDMVFQKVSSLSGGERNRAGAGVFVRPGCQSVWCSTSPRIIWIFGRVSPSNGRCEV